MNPSTGVKLLTVLVLVASLVPSAQADVPEFMYETVLDGYYLSRGNDMVVDGDGNAYVIASWYENHHSLDILLFKLDAAGDLVWTLPIVGDSGAHDYAADVVLDAQNNVWITGWTSSESFPTTPDALHPTRIHFRDAFLTMVSAQDGTILYSTFIGGDYTDEGQGIAFNDAGEIYLVGTTGSTDFPTTPDAYQGEPSAPLYIYQDVFIMKLNAAGNEILYSTYFGGCEDEWAHGGGLDADENIIIAGRTNADDFPLASPIQSDPHSIFVAKLSADGSTLLFGTYLGGEDVDYLRMMAVGADGCAYLAGSTRSADFPTTPGAFQEYFVGEILGCEEGFPGHPVNCADGFVTKVATDGSGLVYGTFLGGDIVDDCHNIVVDEDGCAHVVGFTTSLDFLGAGNTYVSIYAAKLSADGSALVNTLPTELNPGAPGVLSAPAANTGRRHRMSRAGHGDCHANTAWFPLPMTGRGALLRQQPNVADQPFDLALLQNTFPGGHEITRAIEDTLYQLVVAQAIHRHRIGVVHRFEVHEPGHDTFTGSIFAVANLTVFPIEPVTRFGIAHQAVLRGTQETQVGNQRINLSVVENTGPFRHGVGYQVVPVPTGYRLGTLS